MASQSSQDKERRINISINRLIAQHINQNVDLSSEDVQTRQRWYAQQIKKAFDEYGAS